LSVYIDSSFLVSLYIRDQHSHAAIGKMTSDPAVWLTPLHVAEWTHAVEQHVFRRATSRTEADQLYDRFQRHRESGLWVEVAVPESSFDVCAQLARRHVAQSGVRTLDTLHVAAALELKAECFWTFDDRQAKLAKANGLKLA